MKELLELYLAFLKIGCVNFGGGYAMLPLLQREIVTSVVSKIGTPSIRMGRNQVFF